ncbi:heme peroxidase [Jimgerdemannia flammicorona]|uniref:Peroxidase n=1 Tax=Jimgerdemannia flammicorona TaxID=994334 RepID=A0A433QQ93_9FUNG|nr:heme peroxidase [Jimgerdemannia flammicorona]
MSSTLFRATSSRAVQTRSLLLASAVAVPAARARVPPHFLNSTRAYSTEPVKSSGSSTALWWGVGLLGASAGYYFYSSSTPAKPVVALKKEEKKPLDYNEVYKAIADILDEDSDYDDGSYGPILIRLAWHASGTYDKTDGTGGSNGATMRFDPEGAHGANAGLAHARDVLEKIKKRFPDISYSDLWTLAGVVAVQEAGGPTVPWRAGRVDKLSSTDCPPDGRLPDAAQGQGM